MQIHEMFQPKPINEVDLVGPSSIFNVGKQVLKNPKAWVDSNALGAAKQQAADQYGKEIAPQVAKLAQGNIAPLAKRLAQGWQQIGSQLPPPVAAPATPSTTASTSFGQRATGYKNTTTNAPAGSPVTQYKSPVQPTSGTLKTQPTTVATKKQPAIANTPTQPNGSQPTGVNPDGSITVAGGRGKAPGKVLPTDPNYKSLLAAIQKGNPTTVNEDAAGDYRSEFIKYARKVLGAQGFRGVDIEAISKDANTNTELNRIIDRIIATYRDPAKQQLAIEQYFTTALSKWNEIQADPVKYDKAFQGSGGAGSAGAGATPQDPEAELKDAINRVGITQRQLAQLGAAAIAANKNSTAFSSTGNPFWDAIIKSSGLRPR
jgi:hypothetical protein